MLIFSLLLTGMAAGQGLPDISVRLSQTDAVLPDPGDYLGAAGSELQKNYRYQGVEYNTYLYPAPEDENEFIVLYYQAASEAGFEPEIGPVDGNKAVKVYGSGKTGDPALVLYDYQGYLLLMVPIRMNFTLGEGTGREGLPEVIPLPTATNTPEPTATHTPEPTNTPRPTAANTPKPTATQAKAVIPAPAGMTIDENGVLTGYTGSEKDLVIPDGVTYIGHSAFLGLTTLESVVIPDSVLGIGFSAFWKCSNLKSVDIPDSVLAIGWHAFSGCSNLKSVAIPGSVIMIGDGAFWKCTSLSKVSIAEGVSFIGNEAFEYCDSLEEVTISGSVVSIGSNAFYFCNKLKRITISEGVKIIGSYAFAVVDSLVYAKLPDSIVSIGSGAFPRSSVSAISFSTQSFAGYWAKNAAGYSSPAEKNGFEIDEAGNLMKYSGNDSNVIIPDNVTSISSFAFNECESVKSIVIQEGVVSIESYAFSICINLESVEMPDSLAVINSNAFFNCSSLKSVSFGDGLMLLGKDVFYKCSSLKSISIPGSVLYIGDYAFTGCTGLTSVSIGSGVKFIGSGAFDDSSSLNSVNVPDSVLYIGNWAFPRETDIKPVANPAGTPAAVTPQTAAKTPTPRAVSDPNAGFIKYQVTGVGIYGFQIRPEPNTNWFFKEEYQHPVYNGDIVYFTGNVQYGPGYDYSNLQWLSVRTPDGFTGWLPTYILKKVE